MNRILLTGLSALLCFVAAAGAPVRAADVAVPLMETLRNEKPIQLQSLNISARLRGGLAETTVRMAFYNPNGRPLEGTLQFPLLEGQQVTGFALDFDGHMRSAVSVGKTRGRQVFEAIERRGVDPALLEKTQGNNFRLRVFPIPARGVRIVELRYAEALPRQERARRYRLPLAYSGTLREFRLELDSDAPGQPQASGMLGALAFESRGGLFHAQVARKQFAPTGELEVLIPTPDKPQVSVETRDDGSYFVAEVPVPLRSRVRQLPTRIGLLWDSSMSGAGRAHASELALLDRYFRALGNGEIRLIRLRDRASAAQDFHIKAGDWSALRRELEATQYDGASALADWRPEPGVGEYLLVSDGLINYGPLGFPALASGQRLYAINAAQSADRDRLRALAESHGGRLIDLQPGHAEAEVSNLLEDWPRISALSGEGLADLQAAPGEASDGFVRIAGRLLSPKAQLSMRLDDGSVTTLALGTDAPASPLAAHEWASYRLAALAAQPELNRAEIARIGSRFAIATGETSLIVLDRVEDYVEHEIAPPPELAKAYAALSEKRDSSRAEKRRSHLEEVVTAFGEKLEWWNKDFPKSPPPPPKPQPPAAPGSPNSTGSIAGTTTARGEVVIANEATGFRREITADANGNYRVGRLPTGVYTVTTGGQTRTVSVSVGGTASGTTLDTVTVTGSAINGIDIASVQSNTILTAEQIARIPVPRDTTSVALLAPGTGRSRGQVAQPDIEEPSIRIGIKPWTSDAPYMARLRAAKTEDLYAIYLDQRPDYASSFGFYLDVAEVLFERSQRDLALRVLSNLAEMDLDNRQILRILGYRLVQVGEPALAVPVFEKVLRLADYEPQSFRDLGNALAAAGREQEAVDSLAEVVLRPWDSRFSDIELIALAELNAIAANSSHPLDTSRLDSRLRRNLPLDLRAVLTWDADNSDMDLWVTDPNDERCYYGHQLTYQGGRMSHDFIGGYGPEEFSLRTAKKGHYKIEVNYFGDRQQVVAGPTSLQLRLTTKFGTGAAVDKLINLRLKDKKETVLVGEFDVD